MTVTNLQSANLLRADNAFVTRGINVRPIGSGEFDETTTNKSYLILAAFGVDPSTTKVRLHSPLEPGQTFVIVNSSDTGHGFTMLNGDTCWDDATKFLTLRGSDWITTTNGEAIRLLGTPYGWQEEGRMYANTNALAPTVAANGYLDQLGGKPSSNRASDDSHGDQHPIYP